MYKKFLLSVLSLSVCFLIEIKQTNAQQVSGWNWKDTNLIPAKRVAQHTQFLANKFPFPAKPNNQYELGLSLGYPFILGDVTADWRGLNGIPAFAGGISLRKAMNHVWSWRASYIGMYTYGLDWKGRIGDKQANSNRIWDQIYDGKKYYANYRNKIHNLSAELVYSFNTLDGYRGNPKWNYYLFAGWNVMAYDLNINAYDNAGNLYDFRKIVLEPLGPQRKASDIYQDLRTGMDNKEYKTRGKRQDGKRGIVTLGDSWNISHSVTFGFGFAKKINQKINVGVEQRFIAAFTDELDGINEGSSPDLLSITSVKANYNLGKTTKQVEPLWWLNQNTYLYTEVSELKKNQNNNKIQDTDGDGVIDQFDLEANTPRGASVDTHGRALDTDGDGVPDFKDKEPLTQQTCFPVNADGVGNCPEPPCCKKIDELVKAGIKAGNNNQAASSCELENLPAVQFTSKAKLDPTALKLVKAVAEKLKASPTCNLKVIGHPKASKASQQLAWLRVKTIVKQLVEKEGISEKRLLFIKDGGEGDENTVDLQPTTEVADSIDVNPPFPNLK